MGSAEAAAYRGDEPMLVALKTANQQPNRSNVMTVLLQTPQYRIEALKGGLVEFTQAATGIGIFLLGDEAKEFLSECGVTPLSLLWEKYS